MGGRLTVGQRPLEAFIGVRIPAPQQSSFGTMDSKAVSYFIRLPEASAIFVQEGSKKCNFENADFIGT